MFKTNRMRQKRIRTLADALKDWEVGPVMTKHEIDSVVGISPCPNELFQKAHKIASDESGAYFDCVRGVGYVRRPPKEWDGITLKYQGRIRRQARTGRKFVSNIVEKTNVLSAEEQRRASREIGLLQTVEAMSRRVRD